MVGVRSIAPSLATSWLVACAESHSFAIGPTLDGDGHVGVEAAVADGPTTDPCCSTDLNAAGQPVSASFVVIGVRAAVGTTNARPHVLASVGLYVEYLRLGTSASPWGFHATLGLNAATRGGGSLLSAVSVGPNRVATLRTRDTNDGESTGVFTNGLDLSIRLYARQGLAASRWQLGLLYVRQDTWLYP